jgi:hypothetical protein
MGYVVADQDFIAPRVIAFNTLPAVPPFSRPVAESVANGYGELASGAVPYIYSGPPQTGGAQSNYSVKETLAGHVDEGFAQAFPVSMGGFVKRPIWDGSYNPASGSTAVPRSVATFYNPSSGVTLINGSSTPSGVAAGGQINIGISVQLAAPASPLPGQSENVTLTLTTPSGAQVALGNVNLTLSPTTPGLYIGKVIYTAGFAPINAGSGTYTIATYYNGDQVNAPSACPSVSINVTLS